MEKLKFISLLLKEGKKKVIGPELIRIYKNLSKEDKEDLSELIKLSSYPEIPEIVDLYGQVTGNYRYFEMMAGLWIRKRLHIKKPIIVCGKSYGKDVGKTMFYSGFIPIPYVSRKNINLGLPQLESIKNRFEKWLNLVALEPNHTYTVRAFTNNYEYFLTDDYEDYYIEIIKTDYHG